MTMALNAYRQHQNLGRARVDLVLELYDGLLNRLEKARALVTDNPSETQRHLRACELAVGALACGADAETDQGRNFLRLYEFVMHCLKVGTSAAIGDAIGVLRTLREGFEKARPAALQMERTGELPSLDRPVFAQTV